MFIAGFLDQRKHWSSTSLAVMRGIHRWPVNSLHEWPVTRKMFPFNDVSIQTGNTINSCEYLPIPLDQQQLLGTSNHTRPTKSVRDFKPHRTNVCWGFPTTQVQQHLLGTSNHTSPTMSVRDFQPHKTNNVCWGLPTTQDQQQLFVAPSQTNNNC